MYRNTCHQPLETVTKLLDHLACPEARQGLPLQLRIRRGNETRNRQSGNEGIDSGIRCHLRERPPRKPRGGHRCRLGKIPGGELGRVARRPPGAKRADRGPFRAARGAGLGRPGRRENRPRASRETVSLPCGCLHIFQHVNSLPLSHASVTTWQAAPSGNQCVTYDKIRPVFILAMGARSSNDYHSFGHEYMSCHPANRQSFRPREQLLAPEHLSRI